MDRANDYDKEENKGISDNVYVLDRFASLCTLCEEDCCLDLLSSQRSSIFAPSLPLIKESIDDSDESAVANVAVDPEKSNYSTCELLDKPQSGSISSYLREEAFQNFESNMAILGPIATSVIQDDNASFIQLLQKSTNEPPNALCEEDSCDIDKKPSTKQSRDRYSMEIKDVSHTSNVLFEREIGAAVNPEVSVKKVVCILSDIENCQTDRPGDFATTSSLRPRDIIDDGVEEDKKLADGKCANENFTGILKEIIGEATNPCHSDIPDDEIPKKKEKILELELPGPSFVSISPKLPPKKFVKETIISGKRAASSPLPETEQEEIPRKRPTIVDINVPNTPIIYLSRKPGDKTTPECFPELASIGETINTTLEEDTSTIFSPEIPKASTLTEFKECQMPRVNTDANNNNLATSDEFAILHNTAAAGYSAETKRLEVKKKYPSKPDNRSDVISPGKRRRLSNSWSEIENAFMIWNDTKPKPCRKNKLLPSMAISPPNVKRLQRKITNQRKCMTNTLTKLKDLSCYMDQVRDTILAEDYSEKEYTLVNNNNKKSEEEKTIMMVSTGTQTIDFLSNSLLPMEDLPRSSLAVETSMITTVTIGTQTEDSATNLLKTKVVTTENNDSRERKKAPKGRNKIRFLFDEATARAHKAILNASFEEFRSKKGN